MRYWKDEIITFCEEIENEKEIENAELGWHRARKFTAKQIRNFTGQLAEELEEENPTYKFGH